MKFDIHTGFCLLHTEYKSELRYQKCTLHNYIQAIGWFYLQDIVNKFAIFLNLLYLYFLYITFIIYQIHYTFYVSLI